MCLSSQTASRVAASIRSPTVISFRCLLQGHPHRNGALLRERDRAEPDFLARLERGPPPAAVDAVGDRRRAIQAAEALAQAIEPQHAARAYARIADGAAAAGEPAIEARQ